MRQISANSLSRPSQPASSHDPCKAAKGAETVHLQLSSAKTWRLVQVRMHTAILQQNSCTAARSPRQQQLRKPQSMAAAVERAKRRLQDANVDLPEPVRPADPPVIKGQPRDVQAQAGSDVELSVAAMVRLMLCAPDCAEALPARLAAMTCCKQVVMSSQENHACKLPAHWSCTCARAGHGAIDIQLAQGRSAPQLH